MDERREEFLALLKAWGEANDVAAPDRAHKMLNITGDTGLFLWMVLRAWRPARLLEVGTSNGYSTIWWADSLAAGASLVTLERDPRKIEAARKNFREAGVEDRISAVEGDADAYLRQAPAASFDWIFLDSDRDAYVGWWPEVLRLLRPDGLVVVDNAVDKAAEVVAFREVVDRTAGVRQVLVPIGNGELFIARFGDAGA